MKILRNKLRHNLIFRRRPTTRHAEAFSLLEMVVSIGIMGIVMVMLNSVIINMAMVANKSLARSFIREEVTDIAERISRDIRDADRIIACEGSFEGQDAKCEIQKTDTLSWELCGNVGSQTICQKDAGGQIVYQTSPAMKIEDFSFEQGFAGQNNFTQRNILITIVGSHRNPNLEVTNILRQTSVSTRNYLFGP